MSIDLTKGMITYTLTDEERARIAAFKPPPKPESLRTYGVKSYARINGQRCHARPWERMR